MPSFKTYWRDGLLHVCCVLVLNLCILFRTPSTYCLSLYYLKITLHCWLYYTISRSLPLVTKKLFLVFIFYTVVDCFVYTFIWLFLFWFCQVRVVKRRFIECSTENINSMSFFKTFFWFFVWTLTLFICFIASIKFINVASFSEFILIRFFFLSVFIFIGRLILFFSIFAQISVRWRFLYFFLYSLLIEL